VTEYNILTAMEKQKKFRQSPLDPSVKRLWGNFRKCSSQGDGKWRV